MHSAPELLSQILFSCQVLLNCLVISTFAPHFRKLTLLITEMGGTVLKRKARRNKTKSRIRKQIIKVQGFKPVIKSIDVEAIKEEFKNNASKSAATKEKEAVADKPEVKEVVKPKKETIAEKKKAPKAVAKGTEAVEDKKAAAKKPAAKTVETDTTKPVTEKKAAPKEPAAKTKDAGLPKATKKDAAKKK